MIYHQFTFTFKKTNKELLASLLLCSILAFSLKKKWHQSLKWKQAVLLKVKATSKLLLGHIICLLSDSVFSRVVYSFKVM